MGNVSVNAWNLGRHTTCSRPPAVGIIGGVVTRHVQATCSGLLAGLDLRSLGPVDGVVQIGELLAGVHTVAGSDLPDGGPLGLVDGKLRVIPLAFSVHVIGSRLRNIRDSNLGGIGVARVVGFYICLNAQKGGGSGGKDSCFPHDDAKDRKMKGKEGKWENQMLGRQGIDYI